MAEPIPKPHAANWIAPTVFAAILFIALLAFVLAYPTVFHALESSAPDKFAERVSLALANNDPPRAVAIAREAVRVQPFDAMAHTTLGRALLADGQEAAGIAALEAATKIDSTPGPEYMPTRRLYYFAPARLELARLAMDRGDPNEALAHLALAQVHADLEDQTEYQSLLASLKSPFEGGRLFSEEPGGM